nr:NADH dehydrogenase subunit 1 [Heterochaerus australis]
MIKSLIFLISILLSVAFVTLWERKILSYAQSRKGPNLVGAVGVLQPFSDGLKLLSKEKSSWGGNSLLLSLSPLFFFLINLLAWISLPLSGLNMSSGILCLLVLSSLGGMLIFLTGWNGSSSYSFMGGVRASAQMISYEVVMSFFFLMGFSMFFSFSFSSSPTLILGEYLMGSFFILPCWVLVILAETNRAPFDLTEGESELVSGFNTEYSSFPFTLLFLGEYSFIILFSFFSSFLFTGNFFMGSFFIFLILWLRSCFPRKRYDFLMNMIWLDVFPLILLFLVFQFCVIYL